MSTAGNIINITDFNAPELDVYARRTENQLLNREHPEDGLFIAESPKVIRRALDCGYVPVSFLVEQRHLSTEAAPVLSCCPEVPVYTADYEVLVQLTGYALTRGMLCVMRRKPLPDPKTLLETSSRIVVLESIMNPTNIGAIFRSAAALNMDGILLTSDCSNPLYRRSIRVSMGGVFQIPWTFLPENRTGTPDFLKQLGFSTAAMVLRADSVDIDDALLNREPRLAIFLGSEGDGLMPETIQSCDYTVCIPMQHGVDSLNVAAASAIAFWQLGRSKH